MFFLYLDEGAIKVLERAIMAYNGVIILHLSAIINDERAIIGLNEQKNFSSVVFTFKFQQYAVFFIIINQGIIRNFNQAVFR